MNRETQDEYDQDDIFAAREELENDETEDWHDNEKIGRTV